MIDLAWAAAVAIVTMGALVATAVLMRRRSAAQRTAAVAREAELLDQLRDVEARAAQHSQDQENDHRRAIDRINEEHASARAEMRDSFDDRLATESDERERERRRADAILAYSRRAMRWDQLARRDIIEALDAAQLSALVATNIMLSMDTGERSFVAQIDHVVFNDQAIVIIEGKHWAGVTFDGVLPQTAFAGLAPLFADEPLEPPFAVNLTRKAGHPISLRIETTTDGGVGRRWRPPRAQARTQALRLQRAITNAGVAVSWVAPLVYYSHPDGVLFAAPVAPGPDGEHTPAVGNKEDLRRWLTARLGGEAASSPAYDTSAVAGLLAEWGGDLRGTGRYAEGWPGML